jgi:hypothetical protein
MAGMEKNAMKVVGFPWGVNAGAKTGSMEEQTKTEGRHAEIVPLDGYHTGMGGQHAVERT